MINKNYTDILLNNPLLGYAHHRIILDDNNKPNDYEYLEVNTAFEKFTGLKREDILGHTAKQVIPEIEKYAFDWIAFYGEIALDGTEKECEQYSEHLKKWYRLYAYSPKKMYFSVMFLDISQQKKAENALKSAHQFNKQIIDNAYEGIIAYDKELKYQLWNPFMENFTGLSASTVLGKDPLEFFPFLKEHGVIDNLKKVMAEKIKMEVSFPFTMPFSGKSGWAADTTVPLLNEQGEAIGVITTVRDITAYKNIEEKLKENEKELSHQIKLFSALLSNLQIGIFMVEVPSGKPLVANENALYLLGRGILPHASIENLPEVYQAYKGTINTPYPINETPIFLGMQGKSTHIDDMLIIRPDGTIKQLEVFGSPVTDENGQIFASLVSFSDITERKQIEKKLRLTQSTLECSCDALFWSNLDGDITNVNEAACQLLGYTREELLHLNIGDIDCNYTKELTKDFLEELKKKYSIKFNSMHRSEDGRKIPVEIVANYIQFEGEEFTCGFVRDITERQQIEEIQQRHYEELQKIAIHDDLTSIFNRRQGISLLEIEISKAKRLNTTLCCLMVDIDHFKKINDTYGHSVGDKVLVKITEQIQNTLRPYDIFFRFGGEEFVIVLPNQNLKEGRICAERIRKLCDETHFLPLDTTSFLHITLSIGLTVLRLIDSYDELFNRSDAALYEAKNNGRNQVKELL